MLSFIAGLMVGGVVGVVTMCLMVAAKEADAHIEEYDYAISERKSDENDSVTDAKGVPDETDHV